MACRSTRLTAVMTLALILAFAGPGLLAAVSPRCAPTGHECCVPVLADGCCQPGTPSAAAAVSAAESVAASVRHHVAIAHWLIDVAGDAPTEPRAARCAAAVHESAPPLLPHSGFLISLLI